MTLRQSLRNLALAMALIWLLAACAHRQDEARTVLLEAAPNTPPPAQPNANNTNLVANIERLKLNPERILPLHGRMVPSQELYTAAGRKS